MRPHHLHVSFEGQEISRRAAYRFFRDTASGATGEQTGLDVILMALADYQAAGAGRGPGWPGYLQHAAQLMTFAFRPLPNAGAPLIDGTQVMRALDLPPGRMVGQILAQIQEAQATGEIMSAADALQFAKRQVELLRSADKADS